MIVYDLSCDKAHRFEGWFSSADEYDCQILDEQIACPVCGSVNIARELSAPYVNTGATRPEPPQAHNTAVAGVSLEQMRRKFLDFVLSNTEDVGRKFPEEARKIHYELIEMFQLLFKEGNPGGIKALMNIQGTIENVLRLPLYKISDPLYIKIKEQYSKLS